MNRAREKYLEFESARVLTAGCGDSARASAPVRHFGPLTASEICGSHRYPFRRVRLSRSPRAPARPVKARGGARSRRGVYDSLRWR
jgi:hypothetical protein